VKATLLNQLPCCPGFRPHRSLAQAIIVRAVRGGEAKAGQGAEAALLVLRHRQGSLFGDSWFNRVASCQGGDQNPEP